MPADKFSFFHFFCTYVALLETACYQFGFKAASGFILWDFFFFESFKPFEREKNQTKTNAGTFFFSYNLVVFCTRTFILVY